MVRTPSKIRCQSELVVNILLVAVAVAALSVVSNIVISDFIKSRQIRGEIIDTNVVVEDNPMGSIGSLKISLIISCSGPNCDRYFVDYVSVYGLDRATSNYVTLAFDTNDKYLRNGVTRIDVLAYYTSPQFNELVLAFMMRKPDGSAEMMYKSVTLR